MSAASLALVGIAGCSGGGKTTSGSGGRGNSTTSVQSSTSQSVGASGSTSASTSTSSGPGTGDDFAFMDAMQADVLEDQCLDDNHIFLTGFSMGGYFAHHVGCMRPDIRAVAPHSGGTHDLSACTTGHKPIIIFHGTADVVISD